MAREFGIRSYKPEEITYSNVCTSPGLLGQPWSLLDPKLNQNIFLACYDNPMTAEELSIEVGVALPYMEDTLKHLTTQTVLLKKGDKYETNFPIISRDALQKIHYYYEGIIPRLVALITENIDRVSAQYEEAGFCFYGEYQSYEEAKWTLLPEIYKALYPFCKNSPKIKLGNTKRKDGGVWDIVAFEKCDISPEGVGCHHQYEGFVHYRFGYRDILKRTPANLSRQEAHELRLMVEGKAPEKTDMADNLVKYGYAYKKEGKYIPHVTVLSLSITQAFLDACNTKQFSENFWEHARIRKKLLEDSFSTIEEINITVRKILIEDLPVCITKNRKTVDALLESMCTISHILGYIIKHAVASGWLKYDESTSPAIGAFFNLS